MGDLREQMVNNVSPNVVVDAIEHSVITIDSREPSP